MKGPQATPETTPTATNGGSSSRPPTNAEADSLHTGAEHSHHHHHQPHQHHNHNNLWHAARMGNLPLVKRLVEEEGVSVDATNEDGCTALHYAAYTGRAELVAYLLDCGATIDPISIKEKQTPLHWAAISGHSRLVVRLAEEGADLLKSDARGYNGTLLAAMYGHSAVVHYTVAMKGVPVDCQDSEGHTPLHWAVYARYEHVARLLLTLGAPINATDNEGLTPLHWAALKGNHGMAKFLLRRGAKLDIKDKDGLLPEDLALQKNFKHVAQLLRGARSYNSSAERLYWWFWAIIPFLVLPAFLFMVSLAPFWIAVLFAAGLWYSLKHFLGHTWPGVEENNPFFVSWFFSSFMVSFWLYMNRIYPETNYYTMLSLTFILVSFAWCGLYIYLIRSDPGFIPKSENGVERFYQMLTSDMEPPPVLCSTCLLPRPLRSKHCKGVDRCVARMDHWCVWLNNAVGLNNHRPFLVLLASIVFMHATFAYFSLLVLQGLEGSPPLYMLHQSIPFYFRTEALISTLVIYHLLNMVWEIVAVYQQVSLLLRDLTVNEYMNVHRYWYLESGVARRGLFGYPHVNIIHNPFDEGTAANLRNFVNGYPDHHYFSLYSLPPSSAAASSSRV
ncbi:Palmitoyltransferase zdhhc13 [Balamuthia mandrillaris]